MIPVPSLNSRAFFAYFVTQENHFKQSLEILTVGELSLGSCGTIVSDPWPSIFLNRWTYSWVNTDKQVFLNYSLWGNAMLNAWFINLLNTYLLSVDYEPDILVGIEAIVVNKIDKTPLWSLFSTGEAGNKRSKTLWHVRWW